jgi:hypothetical protein
MAISDYSTTAADNTSIGGITVSDATAVDAVDNIIRQLMADIKSALGTEIQAYDAQLAALAALSSVAKIEALQDDDVIPTRTVTDLNAATQSGAIYAADSASNLPVSEFIQGFVSAVDTDNLAQMVITYGTQLVYFRRRTSGTWGSWIQLLKISDILDEDNFSSDSDVLPPTQQSTAAYITTQINAATAARPAVIAGATSDGSATVTAEYGCTYSRRGAGQYRLTFDATEANTNYLLVGLCGGGNRIIGDVSKTTTYVDYATETAGSGGDNDQAHDVYVFRLPT